MTAHEFLWLDLETTGLDPAKGLLLEFAAVLCEDARGDDLAIVSAYHGAIHHDEAAIEAVGVAAYVRAMHTRNGLWADVAASTATVEDADAFLAALALGLTGGRKRSIVLAGSSVHFDLAWSRVHLPAFAEYLSHQVFDVRTLRRACDAWGPEIAWPPREAHRALDDVYATISEARAAKRALFAGGAS